jgi:putrescine transport system substrate-binding protein
VQPLLGKDAPLDDWDNLFNPQKAAKLKGCGISVLDDAKAVFATTLHYLGKQPNSRNPADYQAAFQTLQKIRPTSSASARPAISTNWPMAISAWYWAIPATW